MSLIVLFSRPFSLIIAGLSTLSKAPLVSTPVEISIPNLNIGLIPDALRIHSKSPKIQIRKDGTCNLSDSI